MPFRDYVGTEFVPYLLPIIPHGAPLSPKTKALTPEKIGKIPGRRLPDGWVGFPNWQSNISSDAVLAPYAKWYHDQPCETIGINSKFFPGADSDFDNPVVRDIVIDEYVKRFGSAPIRTRPNSFKILIPLRLAKGSLAVTKIRRVFEDPYARDPWPRRAMGHGGHAPLRREVRMDDGRAARRHRLGQDPGRQFRSGARIRGSRRRAPGRDRLHADQDVAVTRRRHAQRGP
jgi:hypothetical protein